VELTYDGATMLRNRVVSYVLVGCSIATALAFAQGRRPVTHPRPPPAVDASAPSEARDAEAQTAAQSTTDGGLLAVTEAGVVPPPSMLHGDLGDGGVRSSPLNPAPNEFAQPIDAGAPTVDYDKLIADIAALRGRVAAVGDNLFHSRIALQVRTDGDHGRIGRLVVSLDDGAVYTAPQNFKADDWQDIYAHALAPGRHAITVDVERKDDRNDSFRNSQRSRFIVEVPRDLELLVQVKIGDDSDMGKNFPSDKSGSYDLRVRLKAEARQPKASGH
jgi:hypothetical protein